MANETQNKPGEKTPVSKQPDKPPAPKQPEKAGKPPEKPAPQNVKPTEQKEASQTELDKMQENNEKNMALAAKLADNKVLPPKQLDKAPAPKKNVTKKIVPFDKNKAVNEGKAPAAKPQPGKAIAPAKKAAQGKTKPPAVKAQADKETKKPEPPPLENPFLKPSGKTGAQSKETVVEVDIAQLHPFHTFRKHPYQVKENAKMAELVDSIKINGVMQPGLVRPEKNGDGYEMIAGHCRRFASHLANKTKMPVIIREMTDLEAVRAMKDSNKQRDQDLPSERAAVLDLELEALKHQGAQDVKNMPPEHVGKRSNEIVAETNGLTVKQVQRYIRLTKLEPELLNMVDDKKIGFTPAVEISYIRPKNQKYIAVAIEGQQSAPSLSQAQRMRELDQKNLLIPDVIDGILLEEKKEVDKVILSTQELGQYFGKETTPREMKDTILKLLDEYKDKQKDISLPEKKNTLEK